VSLKSRLSRIERHLDSMKPTGRVHVVWPGDPEPSIGPNDTLIRVVYQKATSIKDTHSRSAGGSEIRSRHPRVR
jgi:hypothetical protein